MNDEYNSSYLYTVTNPNSWQAPDGSNISCVHVDAGHVNLPSGRVCIGDPYMVEAEENTVKQTFSPGKYAIKLCLASIQSPNLIDTRVAAAMMILNENKIKNWVSAQYEGVDPDDHLGEDDEDESRGYGVDMATSCFVSPEAISGTMSDEEIDQLSDNLTQAVTGAEEQGKFACEIELNGQNLIAFKSGFGDGFYYNWIGLDADDEPCMLLTAFNVLGSPDD